MAVETLGHMCQAAGLRGMRYTLEEAREIRRKTGMEVDF